MKSDVASVNTSRFDTVRRRLNIILIRATHIDVQNKQPEETSLAEVFGNMDAWGYLILLLSLVVTLMVGFFSALLILTIWPRLLGMSYLAAIPAVFAGFGSCYCLFRVKHWLKL
jgi:hypothetical protein